MGGEITLQELQDHTNNEDLKAYFSGLGITAEKAWDIFKLIDEDYTGTVSMQEFVEGCLRLRGPAKHIDVACVIYEVRRMQKKFSEFMKFTEVNLRQLNGYSANLNDSMMTMNLTR